MMGTIVLDPPHQRIHTLQAENCGEPQIIPFRLARQTMMGRVMTKRHARDYQTKAK
jgi:hypothetical protein